MDTKPILAFDCSTPLASIALAASGRVEYRQLAENRHAAELVAAIDTLMRKVGLSYAQLGTLISTVGPGSFTGVRIGLAALHGLALASNVGIKTTTSLEAMAWSVHLQSPATETYVTGLRAGKGEAYMQAFKRGAHGPEAAGEIYLCPENEAAAHAAYFGNLHPADHPRFLAAPDARVLCAIAPLLPSGELAVALPSYVRAPDAAIPKPPAWLA